MKHLFITLIFFIFIFFPNAVFAEIPTDIKIVDSRVLALKYYLKNYDSPLAEHAELLVTLSDQYKLDWKLIPSIAAVESNFGHKIPGGKDPDYTSHNAWGWGVYGTKVINFRSWEDGIDTVVRGIRIHYSDLGMITPYQMNNKYSSNPDWGWQVDFFMQELDDYTHAFEYKFGAQISAHNHKLHTMVEETRDAKRFVFPKTEIHVSADRLRIR